MIVKWVPINTLYERTPFFSMVAPRPPLAASEVSPRPGGCPDQVDAVGT
jgi:hypothetical protein